MSKQCKDCKRRYVGCHSRCKAYQDFKVRLKNKHDDGDIDYMGYLVDSIQRMKGNGRISHCNEFR